MMKRRILFGCVVMLAAASVASAAIGEVDPTGLTGLWRFASSATKLDATVGSDLTTSNVNNSAWYSGPWTEINPGLSDGGVVQERSWDYLTVNPNFVANGGGSGSWVNEYTIVFDYQQTSGLASWNSLYQTNAAGNTSDGDLFIKPDGTIGVGDTGYSTATVDSSTWHRYAISVDNGSFFRVYVDGVLILDGIPQAIDGRFSLYTDKFHLFADDSWEDQWGLVGTVATWNRAMGSDEVADMGGWINGATMPTALTIVPEPATMILLGLGSLVAIRRKK